MFCQVKWTGSGSSYFRRPPVDCTTRVAVLERKCRPTRGVGAGAAVRPALGVSWEESFVHECCDVMPVHPSAAGRGGRYAPWELRVVLRVAEPGMKPTNAGATLGEGVIDVSRCVQQTGARAEGVDDADGWGPSRRETLALSGGTTPLRVSVSVRTRPVVGAWRDKRTRPPSPPRTPPPPPKKTHRNNVQKTSGGFTSSFFGGLSFGGGHKTAEGEKDAGGGEGEGAGEEAAGGFHLQAGGVSRTGLPPLRDILEDEAGGPTRGLEGLAPSGAEDVDGIELTFPPLAERTTTGEGPNGDVLSSHPTSGKHRRSWSWSMQWVSSRGSSGKKPLDEAWERAGDGEDEASAPERSKGDDSSLLQEHPLDVVIDDDLMPTPSKPTSASSPSTSASASSSPEAEAGEGEAGDKRDDSPTKKKTSTGGWGFGSLSKHFRTKSAEEMEAALALREEKAEADRAEKARVAELHERAKREELELQRVLDESRAAAVTSLPRRRSLSDESTTCVLVTPPVKRSKPHRRPKSALPATPAIPETNENESEEGAEAEGDASEPPVNCGRSELLRNLSDEMDAVAMDASDSAAGETTDAVCSQPGGARERSAGTAGEGEWLQVELRGMPSRAEPAPLDALNVSTLEPPPARIRAMVFFASLDQRSASGEGACTLCCIALAEWLEANPGKLPTAPLDSTAAAAAAAENEQNERVAEARTIPETPPRDAGRTSPQVMGALAMTPPVTPAPARPTPALVMDGIISGAAREWRRLCEDEDLVRRFPDRHFDLDTAMGMHEPFHVVAEAAAARARLTAGEPGDDEGEEEEAAAAAAVEGHRALLRRPGVSLPSLVRMEIDHGASFVGFLSPPGVSRGDCALLDMLTEAAPPLPAIIDELAAMAPATFIVSWNDHFFVMRFVRETKGAGPPGWDPVAAAEAEAEGSPSELIVYVMDSLGERLCEGCKRAFVLRFDGASDRSASQDGRASDGGGAVAAAARFIGEVLPSRMLRHVSAEVAAAAEPGGPELDPERLMRRLQIEFHRVKPA